MSPVASGQQAQHHASSRNIWKRLSLLIEFFGKDKLITDITDDDVRALIAWRRGHRVIYKGRKPEDCALITPATVNLTIMQLKALFATLRPRVARAEWRKLWLPVRQEHPRELVGDEGDRLEAATRDDYAPLFAFAMATGMRQNECLLRWSEVDWGARQIRKTGKGGRSVTVPIIDESAKSSGRCAGIIRNSSSPMSRCGRIEAGSRGGATRSHWPGCGRTGIGCARSLA